MSVLASSGPLPGTTRPLVDALGLARLLTLVYVWVVALRSYEDWDRPLLGFVGLGVLTLWSALVSLLDRRYPRSFVLSFSDLAVAVSLVGLSRPVQGPELSAMDVTTLPTIWVATVVAAWALRFGWRGGLFSAGVLSAADVLERGHFSGETVRGAVMLLVLGATLGYLALLVAREAESAQRLRVLEAREAAALERERLVRLVHDSTLQDLAFLASKAAPELAARAHAAEVRLRNLLSARVDPSGTDLVAALRQVLGSRAELSTTSEHVSALPEVVEALSGAVDEALRNAARHAPGAPVWVSLDDLDGLTVTVRDAGPGFVEGRLSEARSQGRLGVSDSIVGRLSAVGGTAVVRSSSEGVEVELRV